jgi:hypothetical protein
MSEYDFLAFRSAMQIVIHLLVMNISTKKNVYDALNKRVGLALLSRACLGLLGVFLSTNSIK